MEEVPLAAPLEVRPSPEVHLVVPEVRLVVLEVRLVDQEVLEVRLVDLEVLPSLEE